MRFKPHAALPGLIAICAAACSMTPSSSGSAGSQVATADRTLVPDTTWDAGMPDGIPVPEKGTLVLTAEVALDNVYNVGKTPFGQRVVAVTQEGTMTGPKIQAKVLPGGLDFNLELSNGVEEVEQILVLQTSDQKYAIMRNVGTGASDKDVRVVYDFEAPMDGEFAWLNSGKYVGRRTIDAAAKKMTLSIYEVSGVPVNSAATFRIQKPTDKPPQPWSFRVADAGEERGETILNEGVALGRSQAIRNGKNGNRNVIPITGGTIEGIVSGKVLFGGADYQSPTTGPAIDARYLWQTTDGQVIIVRNAGPGNALIPTFETSVDGKFAWLNSGKYASSPPGGGKCSMPGLCIAMYKIK
jgi:Protein of unknown function (DUF3237)